jgi:hypothetical protein
MFVNNKYIVPLSFAKTATILTRDNIIMENFDAMRDELYGNTDDDNRRSSVSVVLRDQSRKDRPTTGNVTYGSVEAILFDLEVITTNGGETSPLGITKIDTNSWATITATPDSCYKFIN